MTHAGTASNAALPPFPTTDPTRLYRYRDGLYAVDLLTAAVVHLDFFSWLSDHPSDLPTICRELKLCARPTDVLLTLAVANGLAERRGDRVVATDLAREHFSRHSPFHLGPYYASLQDRPLVRDFVRVLRSGRPAHWGGDQSGRDWHRAMMETDFAEQFTAAMDCRGHYLGHALAQALPLANARRVLDVGGGSGIYACALVNHAPHVRATLFDQPPVDAIARRLIDARGFGDAVDVVPGDFFSDPWPADHDVHLLSNVLHDWDEPEVRGLLRRSFDAMPAGGLIVIHEAFINDEKTGPLPVAEYSAILAHSTQGKCYATSEYAPWLAELGFRDLTFAETVADRGVMTARKA